RTDLFQITFVEILHRLSPLGRAREARALGSKNDPQEARSPDPVSPSYRDLCSPQHLSLPPVRNFRRTWRGRLPSGLARPEGPVLLAFRCSGVYKPLSALSRTRDGR